MLDLLSDDARRDPYPAYDALRAATPVLHVAQPDLWMLFDHAGVRRALTEHDVFSSSMETAGRRNPAWFIFFDPPRQTALRALVLKAFTPRVVAALEPRIRALSRALLDAHVERGIMDLASDFAVPLPLTVIGDMLGLPRADQPLFRRWSDAILALSHTVPGGTGGEAASDAYAAATDEMRTYVVGAVEARRRAPADDLLAGLVDAEVDGTRLGSDDILGFFQLLLVAGTETTTNLITNFVLCLADHPDESARLRATPALLSSAIEETVRFRSPVQWMFRATRRDVDVGGQTIPAGALVLPVIGAANRDPAQFREPHRFDVGRDPNPHLGFGHGIHFCLGAALARLEARIALGDLLARLHDLRLATDEPWPPRAALHVHGPARLPVRFTPAAPAL